MTLPCYRPDHQTLYSLLPAPCSSSGSSIRHNSSTVYEALLDWADAADMAQRPVAVEQHPDFGRCLVATQDIPNGTVLLSVPLEQVFQSQVGL